MYSIVNGVPKSEIAIVDRGLQYGDGVFETVRYNQGSPVLLSQHLDRFKKGADLLSIPFPIAFLEKLSSALLEWQRADSNTDSFICKWILTRGSGGRGYVSVSTPEPTLVISFMALPDYPAEFYLDGIESTVCQHPLSISPVLSGIKHLNRLDQVLASSELGNHPEGVMTDGLGRVIEGTKSNLLLFINDKIITPKLDKCGVQGCLLSYLLELSVKGELGIDIEQREVSIDELRNVESVAFINSVIGIWPVASIDSNIYTISSNCRAISALIRDNLGL